MTDFDSQTFLQNLTTRPGVYRMLAENGDILYVGKAKNLRNRVGSYFRKTSLDAKTLALVARVADVSVTVTDSETEALLLEQSQIKEWRPLYNILFKDDKSYPYIYLSLEDDYPRLAFHRGARKKKGRFFGPFPSAYSVRDSINVLQKAFRVRSCEDSFYRNRSRPCLQYQIKRCSGPCCQLINQEDYQADVANAVKFLEGKSSEVLEQYSDRMDKAAANLQYEKAAIHRDQILQLRKIQEQQHVVSASGNIDVIFAEKSPSGLCVLVMFIRGGRMLGNKNFFPSNRLDERESGVLSAFLSQFYFSGMAGREVPDEVVVNARLADKSLLETALRQARGRKVRISDNSRGTRARWLGIAGNSAKQALGSYLAQRDNLHRRFEALQQALELDQLPDRRECFDISHTQGEATVDEGERMEAAPREDSDRIACGPRQGLELHRPDPNRGSTRQEPHAHPSRAELLHRTGPRALHPVLPASDQDGRQRSIRARGVFGGAVPWRNALRRTHSEGDSATAKGMAQTAASLRGRYRGPRPARHRGSQTRSRRSHRVLSGD
ncbi:MAG: excinuclease ABC subunit UvrC, partial [bacterium]